MNQPYTYLIGWSKHNIWYYGCRYAVSCNPSDLWVTYFTSSKRVKLSRELFGEPDVVQVRRVFSDRNSAIEWEGKVIKRMAAVQSENWLNMQYNSNGFLMMRPQSGRTLTEEHKRNIGAARRGINHNVPAWNKGIPMTAEAKQHLSNVNKGQSAWNKGIPNDAARGVPRSDEVKAKISEALKGRPRTEKQMQGLPHSDESKKKMQEAASRRRWYNNGEITRSFNVDDIIPDGFIPGRLNFNPHRNKPKRITALVPSW